MLGSGLEQLTFKGMREHVAEMLRRAIFEGTFKPGDLLKDTALAQQLNVSRGPVREALLLLEKESLVKNIHNKGWFVIELTREELCETIGLRAALEVLALKLAAANITSSGLKCLAGIQGELRQSMKQFDWVEVLKKDYLFHQRIWHSAGHRLLEETLVRIATPYFAFLQAGIRSSAVSLEDYESTLKTHQILIDYLAKRSKLTAEECIRAHLSTLNIKGWDQLLRKMAP